MLANIHETTAPYGVPRPQWVNEKEICTYSFSTNVTCMSHFLMSSRGWKEMLDFMLTCITKSIILFWLHKESQRTLRIHDHFIFIVCHCGCICKPLPYQITIHCQMLGSRAAERLCCVMLPRFWLFWTTFTILNSSEIELKQGPSTWITHVSSDAWNLWIKIPKYVYGFLPWYLLCCKLDTLHQPRWPSLNRTPACDWLLCVLTGYLV